MDDYLKDIAYAKSSDQKHQTAYPMFHQCKGTKGTPKKNKQPAHSPSNSDFKDGSD